MSRAVMMRSVLLAACAAAFVAAAAAQNISTVAGGGSPVGLGATVFGARTPTGVAVDASGNLYLTAGNQVWIVNTAGVVTGTIGNGGGGYNGDGGPAASALLSEPTGVAVDSAGNVYIADYGNNVIREVTATTGIITTIAGFGFYDNFGGDGGPATNAQFSGPFGIAVDAAANVYIADSGNRRVRKITAATGIINTVAGSGSYGDSGDGGPATLAALSSPEGVVVDSAGNIYISDSTANVIREVTAATGVISTIAGGGMGTGSGVAATSVGLDEPTGITRDSGGNLYVADTGDCLLRKFTVGGNITTVAGNGSCAYTGDGGAATSAALNTPVGVTVDASGNLFIADEENNAVRKVTAATGDIGTFAGNGTSGLSGNGGPATSAELSIPQSVVVDGAGNLYIADGANNVIRKVTAATGIISTFAGTGTAGYSGDGGAATSSELNQPSGLAFDTARNLYIADTSNVVIRKVTPDGAISTVAGDHTAGFSGDSGAATGAELSLPEGVAVDSGGNLYIADSSNDVIRKVTAATGIITTIAGTPNSPGYSGDGGPATSAKLSLPYGVAVDSSGNVYISDSGNNVIRMVAAATGVITTIAGNDRQGYTGDGGPATGAELYFPDGIAVDSAGNVYTAEVDDNAIRKFAPGGNINTIAGTGATGFSGDGGPATSAELAGPYGVTVTLDGQIYIADSGNNRIRMISIPAGVATHVTVTAPASATSGVAFNNLVVTALDVNNNVATGYAGTVHFTSSDGAALLPADSTLTSGTGTFSATLKTTGNQTITATDTVTGTITGTTGTITVSGGPATHFTVTAPAAATSGVAFNNLVVTALDVNNNVATGYTGTAHFTSSDAAASLPANSTLTNGTGTFSVTLKTTGNQTITATDTVTGTIVGTTGTILVSAGSATHFTVTGPATATAGVAFSSLVVTALDAGNNVVSGYAGTVHFTSSDTTALLPANSMLTNGTGTFSATLKTLGNQTITATDTLIGATTGTTGMISVSAGSATHFTVTAPAAATAGVAFNNLVVTALDAGNNVATGYAGTVHFTSTDAAALLPANSPLTNGTGTFSATFKTIGNQTITAADTVTGTTMGTTGMISVSAGAATHFTVTAPAAAIAGVAFNNLVVTALDAGNNVATGYAGTMRFTSTDAAALLPANSTLTNGTGTFSATLKTAGNQTITATDTVTAGITGTSNGTAVTKPVLTVTANSLAITVGSAIPTLTAAITGFINGDTAATALTGAPNLSTTATASSGVGSYPITVTAGTLAAANYTFNFVNGTLTIQSPPPPQAPPPVYYIPPILTIGYGAPSISLGGTTTLTFSLTNENAMYGLSGVAFTDNLPAGLIATSPGTSTSSCGPVTIAAGSIGLSGGTLSFGGTCSFSATVMGAAVGTLNNTTSTVASAQALDGSGASASLTVAQANESISNSGSLAQGAVAPNLILSYFGPVLCLPNEQVLINGTAATILFASATQVNFVAPGSLAAGSADIQIVCTGDPAVTLTIPGAAVNPAIFTLTQNGKGQGAIVNLNGTVNSPTAPAPQGSYISVYGTGFGGLSPAGTDGLRHLAGTVTAIIGSLNAPVVYAGEAPDETSGLQQINLQVPSGLTPGPSVPIVLMVNGVSTQTGVTMAVE